MWVLRQIVLAAALLLATLCAAEPISQLHPTNYVNDFAHVLNNQTVAELNDTCRQVDQKAHSQIAVATINTLDGMDIERYAVDLFNRWGIGSKATNRGVLILLAVRDRKYRIEVGYGLESVLSDEKAGAFGREAVPLLKQSDYSAALNLMTLRVADVIAQEAGVRLTGGPSPAPPQSLKGDKMDNVTLIRVISGLISIIFFLAVLRAIFGGRRSRFVPGTSIVLNRFRVTEDPSAKTVVELGGRASGIISWVMTLLRLEPKTEFVVTESEVSIRAASLSGTRVEYIPLEDVRGTICGYYRSLPALVVAVLFGLGFILAGLAGFFETNREDAGSEMQAAFACLVVAAVALLIYFLSKRISIIIDNGNYYGVIFKRSVVENVSVDLPQALRAIAAIKPAC
jgi:uncharacterized membrane protein YgcG